MLQDVAPSTLLEEQKVELQYYVSFLKFSGKRNTEVSNQPGSEWLIPDYLWKSFHHSVLVQEDF